MSDPYASPFGDLTPERAEWREVILAGRSVPALDDFDEVELARWAPKITEGDFTLDSDDLMSALVLSDKSGGGQVARHTASTGNRFRDSTGVDCEHPQLLALLPKVYDHTGPNTTRAFCIGDYPRRQDFYAAFGTLLRKYVPGTNSWTGGGDLTAQPVAAGVEYKSKLWIPLGASGIASFDSAGPTVAVNMPSTVNAISLVLWDNKLAALTTNGELRFYDGTTWSAVSDPLTLPTGLVPRLLVVFHDSEGNKAIHVVTDEDVWVYDPLTPKLLRTGVQYPPHPDQGLAARTWRDTDLYIAVGMGVHPYNGGVVSANGLDRNDGVPAHLRGAIVSMWDEYNGLLCLVRGANTDAGGDAGIILEETQIYDKPLIFPASSTVSTLWRFTGKGWFKLWQSSDALGEPTNVMVSRANGNYAMWWGYAGKLYRVPLDTGFANPDQGMRAGTIVFQPTGSVQSGKYDHSLTGFDKLFSHAVVIAEDDHLGAYDLWYRTDRRDWTLIGSVTAPGKHVLPVDPDGDGFPEGDPYEWIEFDERLTQATTGTTAFPDPTRTSPLIKATIEKFIKLPKRGKSWVISVPLDFPDTWKGQGADELATFLDTLTSEDNPKFHPLIIGDQQFRVRVAQVQGSGRTGADRRKVRRLNIVEVRVTGGS